jgi:DnaK suppressor protein
MTSKEKNEIRRIILEEIQSIEKTILELEELTKPQPQSDANDWFTSKESNSGKEINEKALEKNRIKRSQLQQTLTRINNPDFGICVRCKQPIPYARIEVLPATERCVHCV